MHDRNGPWWNFTMSYRSRMGNSLQIIPLERNLLSGVQKCCSENECLHYISSPGTYIRTENSGFEYTFTDWVKNINANLTFSTSQFSAKWPVCYSCIWPFDSSGKMFLFCLNVDIFSDRKEQSHYPGDYVWNWEAML